MTSSITRTAVTCRPTRLFGYVGGVEPPAVGTWQVPGGHTDNPFCLPRWRRRIARWRGRAGNDGVWRRVDWAHGWFTLVGAVDPHPAGKRAARFCFELLVDGPGTECGTA